MPNFHDLAIVTSYSELDPTNRVATGGGVANPLGQSRLIVLPLGSPIEFRKRSTHRRRNVDNRLMAVTFYCAVDRMPLGPPVMGRPVSSGQHAI